MHRAAQNVCIISPGSLFREARKIEILIDTFECLTNSRLVVKDAVVFVVPVMKSNERCRDEDEIVSIVSRA